MAKKTEKQSYTEWKAEQDAQKVEDLDEGRLGSDDDDSVPEVPGPVEEENTTAQREDVEVVPEPADGEADRVVERLEVDDAKLNECAEELIRVLPPEVGMLVKTLAEEYNVQLWMVVDGVLIENEMNGQLSAFAIDPSWRDGILQKKLTCKYCGKVFPPVNVGQLYCSNDCGLAAAGLLHPDEPAEGQPTPSPGSGLPPLQNQGLPSNEEPVTTIRGEVNDSDNTNRPVDDADGVTAGFGSGGGFSFP